MHVDSQANDIINMLMFDKTQGLLTLHKSLLLPKNVTG